MGGVGVQGGFRRAHTAYQVPAVKEAVDGIIALNPGWGKSAAFDDDRRHFALLAKFRHAPRTWKSHWRGWLRLRKWWLAEQACGRRFALFPLLPFHARRALRAILLESQ